MILPKNTLKDDTSCIFGCVDILPKKYITLYRKTEDDLSRKYVIALDHEYLPMKEFRRQSSSMNEKT